MMLRLMAFIAVALWSAPLAAQQADAPALPTAGSSDDIIVEALRIPREKLPTRVDWDFNNLFASRIYSERLQMFVRCARSRVPASLWRSIIDGKPNSAPARYAEHHLFTFYRSCYPGMPGPTVGFTNTQDFITGTVIDRGAMFDHILRTYAPDATLTAAQTKDSAVRSRFIAREGIRNAMRLPNDRDALVFTSCLVSEQPELATRLVHAEAGSRLEQGLSQALLVEGRSCLGTVKRVTINPVVLRTYVLDAFYRWTIAARGVSTLIDDARRS